MKKSPAIRFTGETQEGLPVFELLEPLTYDGLVVPVGFKSNGANFPWWYRGIRDPLHPTILRAAIVHDYLYSGAIKTSRFKADCYYYKIAREDGLPRQIAFMHFLLLRVFGKSNFAKF